MHIIKSLCLLAFGLVFLVGCAGMEDASPREKALNLMTLYEPVQITALTAVKSPLLADKPDIKNAIKAATRSATDAVLEYDTATRGCLREPGGTVIIVVEGKNCDPIKAMPAYRSALAAMTTLSAELIKHGFVKAE